MTNNNSKIQGSGGRKQKTPPPPYRAPISLASRSFATVQDLICEGEIEGFASASKEELTKGTTAYDVASLKDIYLDETPILNATANSSNPNNTDYNFSDVVFKSKFGTANQSAMSGIPNIDESRSPTGVGVTVTNADGTDSGGITGAVTRQITNPNIDAVIVTLTWPSLQVFEDDGDIHGSTASYKIQIQYDNGGYDTKIDTSVTGRSAEPYARDHRITLDSYSSTVDIRVIRNSIDSAVVQETNAFEFTSLQEVIDNQNAYPNSAYLALRLDSKQFNRIPNRRYRIRGIKVKIPSASAITNTATYTQSTTTVTVNSTAHGLSTGDSIVFDATSGNGVDGTYKITVDPTNTNAFTFTSGTSQTVTSSNCTYKTTPSVDIATGRINYPNGYVFNGVMGAAVYTNCPAMCLLNLLTNTRYGFGDHIQESNIDLFSFVAASKYSNELVDDGTGTGAKESRFSCNVNIQSPKEAYQVINELAGVMRCMPMWSAGSITISQDKETSPSYLFNLSNVTPAGFTYQGSSLKQRHSIISVSYFNMETQEADFEVVGDSNSTEDVTRRQKLGTSIKKIKAFACTSRNQAARLGRAVMFAEEQQSEIIMFETSIDAGVVVRPGAVIEVNDPVRAGARRGGRVVAATTTTVTIDGLADTTLSNLNNDVKISVILSDGSVETGSVINVVGAVFTVNNVVKSDGTTQSTFTSAPNVNSPFLISSTDLQTQLFRVLSVEEKDGINYSISAITYIEGKFNFIENGIALPKRTISRLDQPPEPPSSLSVSEQIVTINNIARSKLIVDWQPVKGVSQYLVNYKFEDGNFITDVVFSSDFEIMDSSRGEYTIEVYSYSPTLVLSNNATTTTFTAQGKTARPEDVENLTIESINDSFVRLKFKQAVALDVLHGGRVYIRHTNQTGNSATFQSSQDVIEAVAGNASEAICPALAGTYLLKFQDDGLRFSPNAAKVSISLPQILDFITVKTDREDTDGTPYNGAKSNTVYDSNVGGLKLVNISITSPATKATGTYDFVDTLDLGGIFSLTLKRVFQGAGFFPSSLFDSRTGFVDTWTTWDGDVADEANAKIAVRTTTDDPSSSPTYTGYNDFSNATFRGRGFQFRATLETTDPAQNMNLQQLGYVATLPSRTEQSSVIASGSGAKAVTFTAPFFVGTSALGNLNNFLPSVNISPQNMATGDFFELSSISGTGFTVHFKNSSNASIDRNFTYSAVGFGKGG